MKNKFKYKNLYGFYTIYQPTTEGGLMVTQYYPEGHVMCCVILRDGQSIPSVMCCNVLPTLDVHKLYQQSKTLMQFTDNMIKNAQLWCKDNELTKFIKILEETCDEKI
jgi:hypothetical protein